MRCYELTYTIQKKIAPEETNQLLERVMSFLPSQPVKKETGQFLVTLEFHSEPEKIEELEKKIKSESQIYKYLILKKETTKATGTKKPRRMRKKLIESSTPSTSREPKVELKDIEKKLGEILGQ